MIVVEIGEVDHRDRPPGQGGSGRAIVVHPCDGTAHARVDPGGWRWCGFQGAAVLARMTSSTGRIRCSSGVSLPVRPPAIAATSIAVAARPLAAPSWRMVVSGGVMRLARDT